MTLTLPHLVKPITFETCLSVAFVLAYKCVIKNCRRHYKEPSLGLLGPQHSLLISLDKHIPQGPIRHFCFSLGPLSSFQAESKSLQILKSSNISLLCKERGKHGEVGKEVIDELKGGTSNIKQRIRKKTPDSRLKCLSLNALRFIQA